jgi:hypothetical protein
LPIFWALDYFKSSQARDVAEGDWTMSPVDESHLPNADQAADALQGALSRWDVAAADTAVAAMARSRGANQLFEVFARYGARDFRSIGHKAIFVANGFRTLQCIGWRHAEPIVPDDASIAYHRVVADLPEGTSTATLLEVAVALNLTIVELVPLLGPMG